MDELIDFVIGIEDPKSYNLFKKPYFSAGSKEAIAFLAENNINVIPGERVYTPHFVSIERDGEMVEEMWHVNRIKEICEKEGFEYYEYLLNGDVYKNGKIVRPC